MKHISGMKRMAGYNKLMLFVLFFVIFGLLNSQITIEDSTKVFPDSVKIDSVSSDSINYWNKNEIISYLNAADYLIYPVYQIPLVFNENFHVYMPFEDYKLKTINGFTYFVKNFSNSLYLQMVYPFYHIKNEKCIINFIQQKYDNIVPVLVSYAGIGSDNMNFAYLNFYKGNVLKRFNINFAYLGESGKWNLKNNYSKNFHINLIYNFHNGYFSYTKDFFKRTVPDFYILENPDSFKTEKIHMVRDEIILNYHKIKSGYQKISVFNTKIYDFFIKRKIKIFHFLSVTPKYEIQYQDSLINYPELKLDFNFDNFSLLLSSKTDFHNMSFFIQSKFSIDKFLILGLNFRKDKLFYNFSDKSFSIEYKKIKMNIGRKSHKKFYTNYVLLSQNKLFNFTNFHIDIKSELLYNTKISNEFPLIYLKSFFRIKRELKYKNSIFLGFEYYFLTKDRKFNYYDIYLHPFLGVEITNYFTLQLDFMNITNEYSYNMLSLMPYHLNIGFKWIFFN